MTKEVFAMLNLASEELNKAQTDFGKGKLVDGCARRRFALAGAHATWFENGG